MSNIYNLTNQAIEDSFEPLLQIDSGSALRDGSGSLVDNIIVTSSYALTASFAENVIPIDTGSLLTTASFNNGTRDLTFTKGDSSTFAVNIPDVSGSILPSGLVSGSSQIDVEQTTNYSSINQYSDSKVKDKLNLESVLSGSLVDQLPSGVVSGSSQLTASYDLRYELSGSVQPLPSGVVSGSAQISFTGISDIPSGLVSSSAQVSDLTSSLATTGSNIFTGPQEIITNSEPAFIIRDVNEIDPIKISSGTNIQGRGRIDGVQVFILETGASKSFLRLAQSSTTAATSLGHNVQNGGSISIGFANSELQKPNDLVVKYEEVNVNGKLNVSENINVIGTLTASLQEGYIWVGDNTGKTIEFPTSSLTIDTASFNLYTQSTDARLTQIELETASLDTRVTDLENFSSSLDATFATDAELASATQSLINSIATKLDTGSYLTDSASFDTRIDSLETFSSSLDTIFVNETEFGIYTQSNDGKVNSLIDATGSYATTGSNNFFGNQTISGSVESTINLSNTYLNPQTITDDVTIPTGLNGLIIGETTIVGDYTIEGNSEVYVFTPPELLDTGSFAITGSNTFNGTQTIISGGLEVVDAGFIIDPTQLANRKVAQFNDSIVLRKVGSTDPKLTVTGSGQTRSDLFPFGLTVGGAASYFRTMNIINLGSNLNHTLFFGQSNDIEVLSGLQQNRVGFFYGDSTAGGTPPYHQFYLDINNENFFIEGSNLTVSQSLNVKEIINLEPQSTLPTGSLGDLAVSGSELYFNDGVNWREVNLT